MIYKVYCLCAPKLGFHLFSACHDSKGISHLIEFQNAPAFHSSLRSPVQKERNERFYYHIREVKQKGMLHQLLGLLCLNAESQGMWLKGSLGSYAVHALLQGRISWTRAFLKDVYPTCSSKPMKLEIWHFPQAIIPEIVFPITDFP